MRAVLSRLSHARVTGIDANPSAIEEARQSAEGAESRACFEQMDANERLPFADGSFDAVFSNDAMCHIPDRSRALREWFRVLKPGGRILFTDASPDRCPKWRPVAVPLRIVRCRDLLECPLRQRRLILLLAA